MLEVLDIYRASDDDSLHQGEVLSEIVQYSPAVPRNAGRIELVEIKHPFCVVLSQECDLNWDYSARQEGNAESKHLNNILLCAAHEESEIRAAKNLNSGIFKRIRQNKDERFHFLEECDPASDRSKIGLPSLVLDFKGYFTVPTEHLYSQLSADTRRCRLITPYAEHLSTRFGYFQSRVALPRDHGMPVR